MFAHILGAQYDIAHGAALSIIIPAWMKYKYKENLTQFARFAENFWNKKGQDEEASIAGINALKTGLKKSEAPFPLKMQNCLPTNWKNLPTES